MMNFGEDMESNVDFHIKDEAERLLKEIELVKKNVENPEFYTGMHLDLKQNKTIKKHFFRLLGSHSDVQVVIYGLGSIEYSFSSQFQLAVALLLKRDFFNWIGNIEIYDPCLSPADIIVFEKLDLKVLTIDENCKRRVQRPTMFYMPYPHCYLIGNLLGVNWSSSCLSQIYLLTNSFRSTLSDMPRISQLLETVLRLERILHFTAEIDIQTSDDKMYADVFSGFSWHFFDADPNIHIDIDKLGCYWLDMQRHLEEELLEYMEKDIVTSMLFAEFLGDHRGPRHLRCNPVPPPPGWIKLNIYGIGTKGDQPGQYSGIFQDEKGKCFDRYRGYIDVEDNVIAGLEALKIGLAGCVEGRPNAQKLIVESDNVILVHYVNGLFEPNDTIMHRLKEIFDLQKRITCAVYHIYEETNETARDLALRG
uniref:Protein SENSITIVITY TO RED LIGHT REDUCED n=1 Tax=Solanum tuberosum TaxID=4113 RepID=M1DIH1_SOLTU